MPKIFTLNPTHNYPLGAVDFVNGAAALPSGSDTSWFEQRPEAYLVDKSAHTLSDYEKMSVETLEFLASEMGLTLSETITKPYLAKAVEVALATAAEADYSVTYANGGGVGDVPTETDKFIGDVFEIQQSALTKEGFVFAGWSDGTTVYQPGDEITMAGANITLTAQWDEEVVE